MGDPKVSRGFNPKSCCTTSESSNFQRTRSPRVEPYRPHPPPRIALLWQHEEAPSLAKTRPQPGRAWYLGMVADGKPMGGGKQPVFPHFFWTNQDKSD